MVVRAAAHQYPQGEFGPLLAAPHRTERNVARDGFRHPAEALEFFGMRRDSTVVEILPGSGGYYMEILAPYLKDRGRYIAANRDERGRAAVPGRPSEAAGAAQGRAGALRQGRGDEFNADKHEIAPPGSADFVLTFRNLHNWIERGEIDGALRAFHKALKPGGVLGVVDHRGRTDLTQEAQMKSGYVRQDYAIALIEKAGFKLAALGDQRQSEGHEGPSGRRLDAAADLPAEGPGPREVRRRSARATASRSGS